MPKQIDDLEYSPDGRTAALVTYFNGKHQINLMNTETGETILEIIDSTEVNFPSFSPDSKRIAFVSYKDDLYEGEVYVINLDGTGLKRLTNNGLNETDMSWSPDGKKIAVQIRLSMLYIMNSDGTDLHQLVTGNWSDLIQGWSPDGKYLLLGSQKTNSSSLELGVYELRTGKYSMLANNFISGAKWSPDGSHIIYVSHEDENQYDWDIFVINSNGTDKMNLTHDLNNEDTKPIWSPNSQWIVFSSRNDNSYNDPNYDIYVVNKDGSGLQQLTKNIQADYYPLWKP